MKDTVLVSSLKELESFAEQSAKNCHPGDVFAVCGSMGAGKTTLICAIAEKLGCKGEPSSPTFSIVNEYPGNPTLVHFDWYRLEEEDELFSTGYYDYLDSGAVLMIEWSERFPEALPNNTKYITITSIDENTRKITIGKQEEL